ncbi:MAG: hypothetical protein OEM59_04340 [Rhodospirillales bacterium]|nr:hypothetical protein [Rhodospirillales bacterium]
MHALVESVIRDLGAMLPGRKTSKAAQEVREQMVFTRSIAPGVTELAEVSEILSDAPGMPHIRYRLYTRDQQGSYYDGYRVLALSSFTELYRRVA